MNTKVDFFFDQAVKWKEGYKHLRSIVLDCGLTEDLKWGVPCYSYEGKNVVLIHGFKNYCALLFHKGVLLKDPNAILIQQTIHVQAARQIRLTNLKEIMDMEPTLKAYIYEAVEIEKLGLTVQLKKTAELNMPEEFSAQLKANPKLKTAFEALTPGRQRGYLIHFSQPKQSKTREARIAKYSPKIMDGKGLNDQ